MKKIAEITLEFFVGFAFGFSFRRNEDILKRYFLLFNFQIRMQNFG